MQNIIVHSMNPRLHVPLPKNLPDNKILQAIVSCISMAECSDYFVNHLVANQVNQRDIVQRFQTYLKSKLESAFPNDDIEWETEHRCNLEYRDVIDVFGQGKNFVVAIELDKFRADQVAKKFVSRMAILPETTIYYISLCYPGTRNMNANECIKYFKYCSKLASRMKHHYAGFIIQ